MAEAETRSGLLGVGAGLNIVLISQSAAETVGGDASVLLGQPLTAFDPDPNSSFSQKIKALLSQGEQSTEPVLVSAQLGGQLYRALLTTEESEGELYVRARLQSMGEQPAAPAPAQHSAPGKALVSLPFSALGQFALADDASEFQKLLNRVMALSASGTSGAVLRLDAASGMLLPLAGWGDGVSILEDGVAARDCWALRAGETHISETPDDIPPIAGRSLPLPCVTVPLVARAELAGMLILWSEDRPETELAQELAEAVKPHLSRFR